MRYSLFICLVAATTLLLQEVAATAIPDGAKKGETKVVGGSPIQISEAPYTVSVRLTEAERRAYGSGHLCGGVVISQRVVATAGHCVYRNDKKEYRTAGEFVLVMGSTYLKSKDGNTLQYYVQQLIPHPKFNMATVTNDIALMFINGFIPWNALNVKALSLNTVPVAEGTDCVVSGWGVLRSGSTTTSNQLQLGQVKLIGNKTCSSSYENLPVSQLCAGFMEGAVDACQGDSGGPLRCSNVLVGIVSYGFGCALPFYPGVYTNVSYYNDWVVQTNNSLDYSVYKNGAMGPSAICGLWLTILGILVAAASTEHPKPTD